MTRFDDDRDMRWTRDDRLLAGDLAEEEPELTALVSAVRSMADAPPPPPTTALQQVLQEGLPDASTGADPAIDELARRRLRRDTGQRVRLGVRIALGVVAAAAVATGAAALEPVPEVIREPARAIISGVSDLLPPWSSDDAPAREESGETAGKLQREWSGETGDEQRPVPATEPGAPDPRGGATRPDSTPSPDDVGNQNGATPGPQAPVEAPGQPADPGAPDEPGPPASGGQGAGAPSAPPDVNIGAPVSGRPYP